MGKSVGGDKLSVVWWSVHLCRHSLREEILNRCGRTNKYYSLFWSSKSLSSFSLSLSFTPQVGSGVSACGIFTME